jgi:hypothetical protein
MFYVTAVVSNLTERNHSGWQSLVDSKERDKKRVEMKATDKRDNNERDKKSRSTILIRCLIETITEK